MKILMFHSNCLYSLVNPPNTTYLQFKKREITKPHATNMYNNNKS